MYAAYFRIVSSGIMVTYSKFLIARHCNSWNRLWQQAGLRVECSIEQSRCICYLHLYSFNKLLLRESYQEIVHEFVNHEKQPKKFSSPPIPECVFKLLFSDCETMFKLYLTEWKLIFISLLLKFISMVKKPRNFG